MSEQSPAGKSGKLQGIPAVIALVLIFAFLVVPIFIIKTVVLGIGWALYGVFQLVVGVILLPLHIGRKLGWLA